MGAFLARLAPAAMLLLATACSFSPAVPPGILRCQRASDCPDGFMCTSLAAATPQPDVMVCCHTAGCEGDKNLVAPYGVTLRSDAGAAKADGAPATSGDAAQDIADLPGPDTIIDDTRQATTPDAAADATLDVPAGGPSDGPAEDSDRIAEGQSCTGAENRCAAGTSCRQFWPDQDGDKHTATDPVQLCYSPSPVLPAKMRAEKSMYDDCCDTDANVFHGQRLYFDKPSVCGGFDYNCSGEEDQTVPKLYTAACPQRNSGWDEMEVPACGQPGKLKTGCTNPVPTIAVQECH